MDTHIKWKSRKSVLKVACPRRSPISLGLPTHTKETAHNFSTWGSSIVRDGEGPCHVMPHNRND